jgi:RNA polymerase sigma-70 factor, ECF subfamily
MMPIASAGVLAGGGLDRLEQLRLEELNGSALSDDELLTQYQAGRRTALDELFRRYRLLAYRVAYRLLGNEADALDAVQEGFVKVLVHLNTFEKRSSFKTWLLRVISNAAFDLGRQRGRQELLSLDAPDAEDRDGPQPVIDDNPAHGLERADLRHLLNEALRTLPESQRRTFVLHADAELSYREVAEVMRISIGTVMSRLYYARQKLRAFLAQRTGIADFGLRIAD